MPIDAKTSALAPAMSPMRGFITRKPAPRSSQPPCKDLTGIDSCGVASRKAGAALIYLVDDEEGLTELYTLFLKETGYEVRAFNHRADVLAALTVNDSMPDLLIMDFLGHAMPADSFVRRCLLAHPALRILIASGWSQSEALFPWSERMRFLQKPFTAQKFLREVSEALRAE